MALNPQALTQSYQPMLQESIMHFLSQFESGVTNFSHFNSMFSRLIQNMPCPTIEITWFYAAVNFHTHKIMTNPDDNFAKIAAIEELLQVLIPCVGPCSSSLIRVAVLAPLVYELHNLVIELKSQCGLSLDVAKVVYSEIRCLVDRLVSYMSMCCFEGVDDHDDSPAFSPCFVDLIKVWTVQKREKEFEFCDDFRLFFPLISEGGRNELWLSSGRVGELAGAVMCQLFMLNLCLKFAVEDQSHKLDEEVRSLAVDTITGFRSCYFFDTLLKMLLESCLPVTSLLAANDEILLREALYGAIVLVDYPFFNSAHGARLCSHHLNSLASTWLFVADRAMQFVRHNNSQPTVTTYMKAFSKSLIHSQLLRWVSAEIGMAEDATKPKFPTPAAFLEWLAQLRRSITSRCSNDKLSMLLDKAMCYRSEMRCELPFSEADGNKTYCIEPRMGHDDGRHGDLEMIDSANEAKFPCNFSLLANEACRKRKGEKDEDSLRGKLLKYHVNDSPIKNFSPFQTEVGLERRS